MNVERVTQIHYILTNYISEGPSVSSFPCTIYTAIHVHRGDDLVVVVVVVYSDNLKYEYFYVDYRYMKC